MSAQAVCLPDLEGGHPPADLFVLEPESPALHGTIFDVIGWQQYPHGVATLYKTRRATAHGLALLQGCNLTTFRALPCQEARACPPARRRRRAACG
jgi:hypothetical protein